jgi:D-alanyl-D-alanine carboxypeptidase
VTTTAAPAAPSAAISEADIADVLASFEAQDPAMHGQVMTVINTVEGIDVNGAAGVSNLETNEALTNDATFRIASVTKTFTAATIMRLYEEGQLDLETPLSATGISTEILDVLRSDGYDVDAINIRHLLLHTSGIADFADNGAGAGSGRYSEAVFADPTHQWTPLEQITFAVDNHDPLSAPGVEDNYSDTGYVILGQVIEATTGMTYAESMRTLLGFDKLGMTATFVEQIENVPASAGPRATQYLGEAVVNDLSPTIDLFGGGGLISSTHDLAVFFDALSSGKVFTQPDTFRLVTSIAAPGTESSSVIGLYRFDVAGYTCWQHSGFWGVLAATCPEANVAMAWSGLQATAIIDPVEEFARMIKLAASPKVAAEPTATPESSEALLKHPITLTDQPCDDVIPAGGRCGLAAVPLDWANPDGETVNLLFRHIPATNGDAQSTVIPLNGGPGISVTAYLDQFVGLVSQFTDRDSLLVDVRGTGASSALSCPAMLVTAVLVDDAGTKAAGECGTQVGESRKFYTSAATAIDIEAIRRALELPKPTLMAFSYGTYLAATYTALFPEVVQGAILDGALPLDGDVWARQVAVGIEPVIQRVCDRSGECDGAKVIADYRTVAAELRRSPRPIPGFDAQLTESLFANLEGPTPQSGDPALFAPVTAAAAGDWEPLLQLAAESQNFPPFDSPDDSLALQMSIVCNDFNFVFDMNTDIDTRKGVLAAQMEALPDNALGMLSARGWAGSSATNPDECIDWPVTKVPVELRLPRFVEQPSIPVLVINGDLDLQTPLNWAFAAASQFSNSVVVKVPNAGHAVIPSAPCIADMAAQFIRTLELPAANACLDQPLPLPEPAAE